MIVFSRGALNDLERLRDFLIAADPGASRRALETLSAAVASLEHLPHRARRIGELGVRELIVPFGNSAYVVRYFSPQRDLIVILRIWHGREAR